MKSPGANVKALLFNDKQQLTISPVKLKTETNTPKNGLSLRSTGLKDALRLNKPLLSGAKPGDLSLSADLRAKLRKNIAESIKIKLKIKSDKSESEQPFSVGPFNKGLVTPRPKGGAETQSETSINKSREKMLNTSALRLIQQVHEEQDLDELGDLG